MVYHKKEAYQLVFEEINNAQEVIDEAKHKRTTYKEEDKLKFASQFGPSRAIKRIL